MKKLIKTFFIIYITINSVSIFAEVLDGFPKLIHCKDCQNDLLCEYKLDSGRSYVCPAEGGECPTLKSCFKNEILSKKEKQLSIENLKIVLNKTRKLGNKEEQMNFSEKEYNAFVDILGYLHDPTENSPEDLENISKLINSSKPLKSKGYKVSTINSKQKKYLTTLAKLASKKLDMKKINEEQFSYLDTAIENFYQNKDKFKKYVSVDESELSNYLKLNKSQRMSYLRNPNYTTTVGAVAVTVAIAVVAVKGVKSMKTDACCKVGPDERKIPDIDFDLPDIPGGIGDYVP
ncbi:hypothetical protein OAT67_07615 [Bacteriovoracaceae bacterium]|nr:hypothetical protein [Bacteriovoracaceae bacterium]